MEDGVTGMCSSIQGSGVFLHMPTSASLCPQNLYQDGITHGAEDRNGRHLQFKEVTVYLGGFSDSKVVPL